MKKDVKQFVKDHKKEILIGGGALIVTAIVARKLYYVFSDCMYLRNVANGHKYCSELTNEEMMTLVPDLYDRILNDPNGDKLRVKKIIAIGDKVI